MQTIYFFITCVYGTDTTSGYETTHEFTRLGYRMVHWVPSKTVPYKIFKPHHTNKRSENYWNQEREFFTVL